MTVDEAKKILLTHRPERPRKTEDRQLQCAIDTILLFVESVEKIVEGMEVKIDD